jgi:hypothetical protein
VPEPEARRSIDLRVLKYAAPILLSLLACTQLVLGLNFGLTPWKGGGFGMFSTVDSPGARTVRVYLETADGEVPTKVPSWLRNRRHNTRSFPADFRVRSLAAKLATATWVYRDEESSSKDDEASDKDGDAKPSEPAPESMSGAVAADLPPERVRPSPDEAVGDSASVASNKPGTEDAERDDPYPRVRGLRPGDDTDDQELVAVTAVRVEVWHMIFEVETNEIWTEQLNQATAQVPAR